MPQTRLSRLPLLAASIALVASRLVAADAKTTEMDPFKVEAEFGVDGLRIQNSTSVLNAYQLEQHGVGQLQDVTGIAPNLFSSNSDSRGFGDIFALRGITNSIFFSAPSVALVVDDVPSGTVSSYPSSLLNIDSVVVKAGPQSTEYGRNAPGGVIDIKSRTPGTNHQGRIMLDYGSYKAASAQAGFDGPLSNQFAYSLGVGLSQRDGYIDNTFLHRSADDRRSAAARGALYWRPDSTLQLRIGGLYEKADDDAVRLSSLFSPDPFQVQSNLNGETKLERKQGSFQAKKKFDWASVSYTTSYQDWDLNPSITDLDLSPLPLASSTVLQREKLWTQEVRFESLPGPGKTGWRAGLFYSDSKVHGDATRVFVVPPSAFVPPGFIQTEQTVFDIKQKNFAVYGNVDHPVTKETTIKLGLRYEHATSDIDHTKASSNNFRFPSPQDPRLDRSQTHDYISATGGVTQALNDSLSLMVKSSLAQKPHGFSGFTSNPTLARFHNERLWSTEAGLTFGPPKGRFGGSVLGFWTRSNDYQFERTVPNSTDFVVVNAKEVISRGLEAKFMWNPVERVWWDFQAGYTDAIFERHVDANGVSVKDNHVPFVPRYTVRTGVTVGLGQGFSANASYGAVGRTFFDERNTSMFSQKAYGFVNAQLRYRVDRYVATLYGQNVFDKQYYQFINPEIFAGSPGAPRRVGVQVSFEY